MGRHSIEEIAAALGARAVGETSLRVAGLAEPASAGPDDLAVAMSPEYAEALAQGAARAALLWATADWEALGLRAAILVERPRLALSSATALFDVPEPQEGPAIHPTALIDPTVLLGPGARIGPYSVIGAGARIGASARVGAHVSIAAGAILGDDVVIDDGVRIGRRVRVGDRCHFHAGVAVGGDGFSYVTAEKSHVEAARESLGEATEGASSGQSWQKIHSLGGVVIGNDVEIGGNSNVDAGTIRATRIGDGTKIDALVQVGHNVVVGRNCLLCAHVAVGGSAVLGDNVVLGGQAGVADNVRVGDGVVAGGASKILSNVPAGRAILGYPAVKMSAHVESYKALRRLPRALAEWSRLKKKVSQDDDTD